MIFGEMTDRRNGLAMTDVLEVAARAMLQPQISRITQNFI
jgi:hypothetical protein